MFQFTEKHKWIHHKVHLPGEMGRRFLKPTILQLLQQELMILCKTWTRSATPFRKPWALSISFILPSLPSMLPFKCHSFNACISLHPFPIFNLFYFMSMSQVNDIVTIFFFLQKWSCCRAWQHGQIGRKVQHSGSYGGCKVSLLTFYVLLCFF